MCDVQAVQFVFVLLHVGSVRIQMQFTLTWACLFWLHVRIVYLISAETRTGAEGGRVVFFHIIWTLYSGYIYHIDGLILAAILLYKSHQMRVYARAGASVL